MNIVSFFSTLFLAISALFVHAAPPAVVHHAQVLFVGDVMFDRTVRTTVDTKGGDYIFSCIDPLLRSQDMVVANLEGPITDNPSMSQYSAPGDSHNFTFTFPRSSASLLYSHNIRMLNLGNNHIENFGNDGVVTTIDALTHAGNNYFGDPLAFHEATTGINGIQFAFINYNEFGGDVSVTLDQIKSAHAAGLIPVVYTHWGVEYQPATDAQKYLAHSFIDAGAEIVIGSHPHVVQEHEVYKGKYIYYSLGNFIFDQYWNDDVRHGLALQVSFGPSGVESIQEIPVELEHDRRTCEVE